MRKSFYYLNNLSTSLLISLFLICVITKCGMFHRSNIVRLGEVRPYLVNQEDSLKFMTIVEALELSSNDDILKIVLDNDFLDFLAYIFQPQDSIFKTSSGFYSEEDYYIMYGKSPKDLLLSHEQVVDSLYYLGKTIKEKNLRDYRSTFIAKDNSFRFILSDNSDNSAPLLNIFTNRIRKTYISINLKSKRIKDYTYELFAADNKCIVLRISDLVSNNILSSLIFNLKESKKGTDVFLDTVTLTPQNAQDVFDKYLNISTIE